MKFSHLIIFIAIALAPLTGKAAPRSPGQASPHAHGTRGFEIHAIGEDQCAAAAQSRRGRWACPATPTRSRPEEAGALSGYCVPMGCWSRLDDARSTYTANMIYGYSSTVLGSATLYFKTTNNGRYFTVYPFWMKSTRAVSRVELSGQPLYLSSSYPGGHPMTPDQVFDLVFSGAPAGLSTPWPSPGATVQGDGNTWVTLWIEAAWRDPSPKYPGEWWAWAKSIKMLKQSNGSYDVQDSNSPPSDPAEAGHSS